MKKYLNLLMMLLMVAVSMTVVSCGGDDDDDKGVSTTVGVHRIDVEFSGDTSGWNLQALFIGSYQNSTNVTLYENGKVLTTDMNSYIDKAVRKYSIESESKCDMLQTTITAILDEGIPGTFSVTLRGYVDGKQTNMKVFEFTPGNSHAISCVFSAEDVGMDMMKSL